MDKAKRRQHTTIANVSVKPRAKKRKENAEGIPQDVSLFLPILVVCYFVLFIEEADIVVEVLKAGKPDIPQGKLNLILKQVFSVKTKCEFNSL